MKKKTKEKVNLSENFQQKKKKLFWWDAYK